MHLRIVHIVQHGTDIREFVLARPDGTALPPWDAGAHIEVRLPMSGKTQLRHYSLVGAPGNATQYRIVVLRDATGRGGSRHIHDHWNVGDEAEVGTPQNSFPLAPGSGQVTLIGGGIGITPLVSMAHQLNSQGRSFELHYLVRSRDHLCLLAELAQESSGRLRLHVSAERSRAALGDLLGTYRDGRSLQACGPHRLLKDISAQSHRLGWPRSSLHFESFGARHDANDATLTVELAQSGTTLQVPPQTTILDALIDAGLFVARDCGRGECGSCFTQVLEGSPLHRDICLTAAQREAGMCTCVSWSASQRLVLDL